MSDSPSSQRFNGCAASRQGHCSTQNPDCFNSSKAILAPLGFVMNEDLAVPALSLADSRRDRFAVELSVSVGRTIKIKIQHDP